MKPYPGMGQHDEEFRNLWDQLVPQSGNAGTVQGQLILCAGRLSSEWRRNGNMNVAAAPEFFQSFCDTVKQHICSDDSPIASELQGRVQEALDLVMENGRDPSIHVDEEEYDAISDACVLWCRANPQPKPYSDGTVA